MVVITPALILSTLRYSESSKIVRLATRDHGVQSALAKGALRPKSRFGASLQLLSEGTAHLVLHSHRELQLLTAFDVGRVHVGLAASLPGYAAASAMGEVMLRFAPPDPDPDSYDILAASVLALEQAPAGQVEVLGIRLLWLLVSALGFAPALDECVLDGAPVSGSGALPFSTREGGALCAACAARAPASRLPADARRNLAALLDSDEPLPALDARNLAAHRRLLSRFIRYHLGDGAGLPALAFWEQRALAIS